MRNFLNMLREPVGAVGGTREVLVEQPAPYKEEGRERREEEGDRREKGGGAEERGGRRRGGAEEKRREGKKEKGGRGGGRSSQIRSYESDENLSNGLVYCSQC